MFSFNTDVKHNPHNTNIDLFLRSRTHNAQSKTENKDSGFIIEIRHRARLTHSVNIVLTKLYSKHGLLIVRNQYLCTFEIEQHCEVKQKDQVKNSEMFTLSL